MRTTWNRGPPLTPVEVHSAMSGAVSILALTVIALAFTLVVTGCTVHMHGKGRVEAGLQNRNSVFVEHSAAPTPGDLDGYAWTETDLMGFAKFWQALHGTGNVPAGPDDPEDGVNDKTVIPTGLEDP